MEHSTPNGITPIHLPAAVFQPNLFTPQRVNLIFGRNGTGKSTFANAFRDPANLSFPAGNSAADYGIFIFDRTFVAQNIQQYGDLPGIVTVSVQNAEIQMQMQSLQQQRDDCLAELSSLQAESERLHQAAERLLSDFQEDCWRRTGEMRKRYEKALGGKKTKQKFADALLHTMPRYHEPRQLSVLYQRAFGEDARCYPLFRDIADCGALDSLHGAALLPEPIISSADSQFSRFMRQIQAVDWVQRGHAQFSHEATGVCPYCQQTLPADFDTQMAACFDAAYQQTLRELQQYYEHYRQTANAVFIPLQENLKERYPDTDYGLYLSHLKLLKQQIQSNLELIRRKIQSPSSAVTPESTRALFEAIHADIVRINAAITEHNQILTDKKSNQHTCTDAVLAYLAFKLQDTAADYQRHAAQIAMQQEILAEQLAMYRSKTETLTQRLAALRDQVADTRAAVMQINRILAEAGFQDFSLRQSTHAPYAYEVVRRDGRVAANLSEGEQRFLAFLYFDCLVRAESQRDGRKIVVIDDPFTALDTEASETVMRLVRALLDDCAAQKNGISQMFVLTSHALFFRETAWRYHGHADTVSVCTLKKERGRTAFVAAAE